MTNKNPYVEFLSRWHWLLALGVLVALVATNLGLAQRVPLYRSTSTVQIGRAIEQKNPNQVDLSVTDRLVPAYAELAKRDPLLRAVIQTLGLPFTPSDIRARLVVSPVPQTQLIDISVVDDDPVRAAAIANEISRQLVLQSPDTSQADIRQSFIETQLMDLQAKISGAQSRAQQLQDGIATMTSAADIAEAQQQLQIVQTQIDTWQQSYAGLISAAQPSSTNLVQLWSEATPALIPERSPTIMYYGLAVVIGAGLASLLALALGMLNSVVAEEDDLRTLGDGVPVIPIPRYRPPKVSPIALIAPNSTATAAYRVLRNSLQANGMSATRMALAVTSSRSGEGKTTTTANLGVALANAGQQVILVDANFRNPELGSLFGADSVVGLSDVMLGDRDIEQVIRATKHPNLRIVTSGTIPPNYLDLLSSRLINTIVADVAQRADVVLFDTPALSEEQESLLVAKAVTGVLMIAEARHVRAQDLEHSLEALRRSDAHVLAIVLNKAHAPRFTAARLPWSREARLQARAAHWRAEVAQHRQPTKRQDGTATLAD